jgi:CRP/FNR family transcriptional regulator, cyclic AMP receptor protein
MAIDGSIHEYLANEERHPDKAVIVREGTSGDWVYTILEGQAKVMRKSPKGLVTVDILKEGDIFGEMEYWLYPQRARSASVVADGPVRVGVLDMERLLRDFESAGPRLKSLIRTLMARLRETTDRAVTLAVESGW